MLLHPLCSQFKRLNITVCLWELHGACFGFIWACAQRPAASELCLYEEGVCASRLLEGSVLNDDGVKESEAHDDVQRDGRAQVVSIQTQVPGTWQKLLNNYYHFLHSSWLNNCIYIYCSLCGTFQTIVVAHGGVWCNGVTYLSLGVTLLSCGSTPRLYGHSIVPLMPVRKQTHYLTLGLSFQQISSTASKIYSNTALTNV